MPCCVGAIDGTYVTIMHPNPERFPGICRCHKGYSVIKTMFYECTCFNMLSCEILNEVSNLSLKYHKK